MRQITQEAPFIDGCECSINIIAEHPAMDRNPENLEMLKIVQEAGKIMNMDYPEQLSVGTGDACLISYYGCPSIDAMGPYMKDIHRLDERMYIPSLKERTMLFALTLAKLDKK